MVGSRPSLDVAAAREVIHRIAAPCSSGPAVGLELEWHTYPAGNRAARCDIDRLQSLCAELVLPGCSSITFEPGGQVELSSPPDQTVAQACDRLAEDADVLLAALGSDGIEAVAAGCDPHRDAVRTISHPRYAAMEEYFDRAGPAGRQMMCGTAALQVNIDAGADPAARWALVHAVGPALAAAFATSAAPGHASERLATWLAMDRTRTGSAMGCGDPGRDWAAFALDARVMLLRLDGERWGCVGDDLTLAGWLEHGHDGVWPDESDVAYHLTTLFPPVRLRGWLELRFLDSLPAPWWRAAAVTTATVLADEEVATGVAEVARHHGVADRWEVAACEGLDHAGLAAVALACVAGAAEASGDPVVAEFLDRFTSRGLAPGPNAGRCVA